MESVLFYRVVFALGSALVLISTNLISESILRGDARLVWGPAVAFILAVLGLGLVVYGLTMGVVGERLPSKASDTRHFQFCVNNG